MDNAQCTMRMNMQKDMERRQEVFICTEYRTGAMTGAWADDPDKAHLTRPPAVSTGAFPRMPAVTQAVYVIVWDISFPFWRRGDRVIAGPLTLRRDVRKGEAIPTRGGSRTATPSIFAPCRIILAMTITDALAAQIVAGIYVTVIMAICAAAALSTTATLDTLNTQPPSGSLLSGPATGNEHSGFIFLAFFGFRPE